MRLYVTLEQLYFGDLLHVSYRRPVLCPHAENCHIQRNDCMAAGVRMVQQQIGPGFMVQNQMQDDSCVAHRKGWKKDCTECPTGPTDLEKTFISVFVEPGMKNNQKLTFEGIGWQMLGHDPGDLILEIIEQPHQKFVVLCPLLFSVTRGAAIWNAILIPRVSLACLPTTYL